jgi:hypothetical protein
MLFPTCFGLSDIIKALILIQYWKLLKALNFYHTFINNVILYIVMVKTLS